MNRRHVLTLVATSPLFAGCSGVSSPEPSDTPSKASDKPPEQTTTTPATTSETPTTVTDSLLRERAPPSPDELRTRSRPRAVEPPDATDDTVPPLSYPDKPATYTTETVADFVEAYERAYRRNDLLNEHGNALIAQEISPHWTHTLATTENAGVGRVQYVYSASYERDEQVVVEDSAIHLVTYYVDESVVVRAATTDRAEHQDVLVPDPWVSGVILDPVI